MLQNREEFGEFWSEHSKVSKICILIGYCCVKYITLDLKKYRDVVLHDTKEWFKIWRKTDLSFGKWYDEFGNLKGSFCPK